MKNRARQWAIVFTALPLLAGAWGVARAEDRTFVLIAAAPGESTDAAHAGWIDAYALDTSLVKPLSGAAQFGDVSILKGTDKATPVLHDLLARGSIAPLVTIEVCRVTSPQQCYYRIELTSASIAKVDLSGSSCVGGGACTPSQTESVSFKYVKIRWIYTPWTGGTPGTPVNRCWDISTNASC
jgi:type VI secretion system Hcp family effector